METILIMLPQPILVSDENIKDIRPYIGKYHYEKGVAINKFPTYLTDLSECKLIIASIDGSYNVPKLDLSLIADGIGWVDVENKVKELMGLPNYLPTESMSPSMQSSFEFGVECFKAAQSLNEKKYSLEDMRHAWEAGMRFIGEDKGDYSKMLMSLSKTKEYLVEVEMEQYTINYHKDLWSNRIKITNNTIKVLKIIK